MIATHRLQALHLTPDLIHIDRARSEPYSIRQIRKQIDAGAFRIYGHWVKRGGENQNRAALFENHPRRELKAAAVPDSR